MRAGAVSDRDYGRSYRFLEDSGATRLILGAKPRRGFVEVPYRSLSSSALKSGHKSQSPLSQESHYFGFYREAVVDVISLVDDASQNNSVRLTDKALIMTENAVDLLKRGLTILKERYTDSR